MKKPGKFDHFSGKPRSLDRNSSRAKLVQAAEKIGYSPSPYHCPDENGKIRRRTKPASQCPRVWTNQEALNAIREAIIKQRISAQWTKDGRFPRKVWHDEGGIWYEACTQDSAEGVYHGYNIDARTLPLGLDL